MSVSIGCFHKRWKPDVATLFPPYLHSQLFFACINVLFFPQLGVETGNKARQDNESLIFTEAQIPSKQLGVPSESRLQSTIRRQIYRPNAGGNGSATRKYPRSLFRGWPHERYCLRNHFFVMAG